MMNRQEALSFAKASAAAAFDQRGEYADAVASYRDNIRDTLNDEGAAEYEDAAWAEYDAEVARLFAKHGIRA